jgi:hypothetical protein
VQIKFSAAVTAVLCGIIILSGAGCTCLSNDPLKGNLKVMPGSVDEGQDQQAPPPGQPLLSAPAQPAAPVERQVTVTAANSVFSIGLPAGYTEEREITASKPIDVWFEYLPSENITLEVNGQVIQIPVRRTTARTGYLSGVTQVKYVLKNQSVQGISYNLRMMPLDTAGKVPVVTREKWTAP